MDRLRRAVLDDDDGRVRRLIQGTPELVRARFARDQLITAIPHWLYVDDTALHLAAAALNGGAVRLMLDAGADANAQNRRRATPLHYACDPRPASGGVWNPRQQAAIIGRLVQHGANVERQDRGGATPLHRAVRARSPAAVRRLLECGARVDCRLGQTASTPLHLAVQSTGAGGTAGADAAQLEIIRLLREHGADPSAKDSHGKSVMTWAKSERVRSALASAGSEGL
jgi:ankyrin repeat protein